MVWLFITYFIINLDLYNVLFIKGYTATALMYHHVLASIFTKLPIILAISLINNSSTLEGDTHALTRANVLTVPTGLG